MQSTWESRDLPVLDAIVSMAEEGLMPTISVRDVASRIDREPEEVFKAFQVLDGSYIGVQYYASGGSPSPHRVTAISEAARRAVGQWPSPEALTERLVAALVEAADAEPDPERKKGLRGAAQTISGIGRSVLVNVLTQGIEGNLPHHV